MQMKFTVVQTDIEDAIRNRVREQFGLTDKLEIAMKFKATRGEDGLQAFVTLYDPANPPVEGPAKTRKPRTPKADAGTATEAAPATDAATVVDSNTVADAINQNEAVAEPVAEGEAPKSLFGGLTKPVNG